MFLLLWQKMEAAYYDNIIEQQRIEPEFFRMGFYGRKFPFFLRVRFTKSSSSGLSWHSYESVDMDSSYTAPASATDNCAGQKELACCSDTCCW